MGTPPAQSNGNGIQPDQPSAGAQAAQTHAVNGAGGNPTQSNLRFVSYRMEISGQQGNPPRNMRQWLLKDSVGREHVAVKTAAWLPSQKCYQYIAVDPFSQIRPLTCRNQREVMAYLDAFVPAEARQCPAEEAGKGAKSIPKPKASQATPSHKAGGKKTAEQASGSKASAKKPPPKSKHASASPQKAGIVGVSGANTKTARQMETKVAAVCKELEGLKAQYGIDYNLTLVVPGQGMKVMTSALQYQQQQGCVLALNQDPTALLLGSLQHTQLPPQGNIEAANGPGNAPSGGKRKPEGHQGTGTAPAKKAKETAAGKNESTPVPADDGITTAAPADTQAADVVPAPTTATGSGRGRHSHKNREAAVPAMPSNPAVAAVILAMQGNIEAYLQGNWRLEPLPSHPLEEITTYVPAEDCGEEADAMELPGKFKCALPVGAVQPVEDAYLTVLPNALPPPLDRTVMELRSVWGLDAYTRYNILAALKECPELVPESASPEDAEQIRKQFITTLVLPALNALGDDRGWDIVAALHMIKNQHLGAPAAAAAQRVIDVIEGVERHGKDKLPDAEHREWFRAHSKGDGLVYTSTQPLPEGAFVGEYLGEVYPAWRWYERTQRLSPKQAVAQRKAILRTGASPKVYNIAIERPKEDSRGYNILYIDASIKGSLASRLGHSCDPNCKVTTTVADGRVTLAVWTTRPVLPGEELTLDYNEETEHEGEYQAATCLCGAPSCRGSFLLYTPAVTPASLTQHLFVKQHTFVDRVALLMAITQEPHLSFDDMELLDKHGIRDCLLTFGDGSPVPSWLRKWAALVLSFAETEASQLPQILLNPPEGMAGEEVYTAEEAAQEAQDQLSLRVKSLAVALDRAKLALRHQSEDLREPPIHLLGNDQIVEYLWTADDSIARRAVRAAAAYVHRTAQGSLVGNRVPRQGKKRAHPTARVHGADDSTTNNRSSRSLDSGSSESSSDRDTKSSGDSYLNNADRPQSVGVEHDNQPDKDKEAETKSNNGTTTVLAGCAPNPESAIDVAAGAAGTDQGVEMGGDAEKLHGSSDGGGGLLDELSKILEETVVTTTEEARGGLQAIADALLATGAGGHIGLYDTLALHAATKTWMVQTNYQAFATKLCDGQRGANYKPGYLLAVLCSWYKSEVDPVSLLQTERRGCFCLPDIDSCYLPMFTSGKYVAAGERAMLLEGIAANPKTSWPSSTPFNFRNPMFKGLRVFGSPQLDVVLNEGGGSVQGVQGLMQKLMQAWQ